MTAWELLRELWSAALDAARSPERFLRRRRALKRIDAAMRRSKRDTPRSRPPRSVPPEE